VNAADDALKLFVILKFELVFKLPTISTLPVVPSMFKELTIVPTTLARKVKLPVVI
jgi:hypothetical protein